MNFLELHLPVSAISWIQFLLSWIMIKSSHYFNNVTSTLITMQWWIFAIYGINKINHHKKSAGHSVFLNWYIQRQYLKWRVQKMIIFMLLFSFCWDSKFIVYCIVNCIEIRFEVLELYCYCIGWNYSLVVLYCNCIAKISIAYYFIWIVLDSKRPYWSTLP